VNMMSKEEYKDALDAFLPAFKLVGLFMLLAIDIFMGVAGLGVSMLGNSLVGGVMMVVSVIVVIGLFVYICLWIAVNGDKLS